MPSALDWLRGRTDEQLTALLTARPDLLVPAPGDLPALARRLESTAAARRSFEQLDQFSLTVLWAIAVLTDGAGGPSCSGHPRSPDRIPGRPGDRRGRRASARRARAPSDWFGSATALGCRPPPGRHSVPTRAGSGLRPGSRRSLSATALAATDDAGHVILGRLAPGPPLGQVDPQSPTAASSTTSSNGVCSSALTATRPEFLGRSLSPCGESIRWGPPSRNRHRPLVRSAARSSLTARPPVRRSWPTRRCAPFSRRSVPAALPP